MYLVQIRKRCRWQTICTTSHAASAYQQASLYRRSRIRQAIDRERLTR